MTPLERYQLEIENSEFSEDPVQRVAAEHTQVLYNDFMDAQDKKPWVWNRLIQYLCCKKTDSIKGLYFWGGVGRGKTLIVDAFFECLPIREKKRIHFHRFMQRVHHELKQIQEVQDPLQIVAEKLAAETRIICFDEFHVSDITDAMLLGGLMKALFERGVILVATSNEHPDQLYSGGLQRERFLPAIELLKKYTQVVNVDSGIDYRLRYLDKAEIYHCPLDSASERMLLANFQHIAPDEGRVDGTIEIEGRKIVTERHADGVVWFDFSAICSGPRGPADYIEIGCQFQTVLIANVPIMDDEQNDRAKRFMTLVDEFYDRNVKLILTAEAVPEDLYQGRRHVKPFERTTSRLIEMQSHDYLARQHLSEK